MGWRTTAAGVALTLTMIGGGWNIIPRDGLVLWHFYHVRVTPLMFLARRVVIYDISNKDKHSFTARNIIGFSYRESDFLRNVREELAAVYNGDFIPTKRQSITIIRDCWQKVVQYNFVYRDALNQRTAATVNENRLNAHHYHSVVVRLFRKTADIETEKVGLWKISLSRSFGGNLVLLRSLQLSLGGLALHVSRFNGGCCARLDSFSLFPNLGGLGRDGLGLRFGLQKLVLQGGDLVAHNAKLSVLRIGLPLGLLRQHGELTDSALDVTGVSGVEVREDRNHQRTNAHQEREPFVDRQTSHKIQGVAYGLLATVLGAIGAAGVMGAHKGADFGLGCRTRFTLLGWGLVLCGSAVWIVCQFGAPLMRG